MILSSHSSILFCYSVDPASQWRTSDPSMKNLRKAAIIHMSTRYNHKAHNLAQTGGQQYFYLYTHCILAGITCTCRCVPVLC